jgi:type IV secretory pathway component VirB8
MAIIGIDYLLPIHSDAPVVTYNTTSENRSMKVTGVSGSSDKEITKSIAKYLSSQYVSIYETYEFKKLDFLNTYISNNSTSLIISKHDQEFFDFENEKSMAIICQISGYRKPTVLNTRVFENSNGSPYMAEVDLLVEMSDANDNVKKVNFTSIITFDMSSLKMVNSGQADFYFTVTSYKRVPLTKIKKENSYFRF